MALGWEKISAVTVRLPEDGARQQHTEHTYESVAGDHGTVVNDENAHLANKNLLMSTNGGMIQNVFTPPLTGGADQLLSAYNLGVDETLTSRMTTMRRMHVN